MEQCALCGIEFSPDDTKEVFESAFERLSYENLTMPLCCDCVIDEIEGGGSGIYTAACETCGKDFDLGKDSMEYASHLEDGDSYSLRSSWDDLILCCDCALQRDGIE